MSILDIARRMFYACTETNDAFTKRLQSADIRRLFLHNALIACYHIEATHIASETLKNFPKARERDQ